MGMGADTLQLQHAPQQSEATYDPISITPAAGRTWCMLAYLPAACGLCRDRYALGMSTLTHRLSLASRCLHISLSVHVGLE